MADRGRRLTLASSSPRRRRLLAELCPDFDVRVPRCDESRLPGETPADHVRRLARDKARTAAGGDGLVVGADTVVVLDGELLGKPCGEEEATAMLRRIAGRCHAVYTGVCVVDTATGRERTAVVRSLVTMKAVSREEAAAYAAGGEPLDKAGAYAVQGEGGRFVASVEGSLSNVIGLPLRALWVLLTAFGLALPAPGEDRF